MPPDKEFPTGAGVRELSGLTIPGKVPVEENGDPDNTGVQPGSYAKKDHKILCLQSIFF
jgi:hypothetical protein